MVNTGLTELEAVVAVARRGNFRAAAVDLGMSASTLSHAVVGLEARLGVRLFNRTTRSVALSAAGEQFLAQVAPALCEIHTAIDRINNHRAKLSVRCVSTPRLLASLMVVSMISWL
jgi:DNA-binding transcriptional LysR family regulator